MLIKDLDAYVVFDLVNTMLINNTSDEVDFIKKYSKIRRRESLLIHTGYKFYYFIIPVSKLHYKDIRLKVYANNSIMGYLINKDRLNLVKNFIRKQNKYICGLTLRYVDIERMAISRLTEVKGIIKTLDFVNKEYLCEYHNGEESLWYELHEDGLYLDDKLLYSILNNVSTLKADFNKITCIREIKNLYTYTLIPTVKKVYGMNYTNKVFN